MLQNYFKQHRQLKYNSGCIATLVRLYCAVFHEPPQLNGDVLLLATILAIVVLTILELRPVVLAHLSVLLRMIMCSVQTSYLSFLDALASLDLKLWVSDWYFFQIFSKSSNVMWCDVMWCDVMWCDAILCDLMWCDMMWCDVMWFQ